MTSEPASLPAVDVEEWPIPPMSEHDSWAELLDDGRTYPDRITFVRDDMGLWCAFVGHRGKGYIGTSFHCVPEDVDRWLDSLHTPLVQNVTGIQP